MLPTFFKKKDAAGKHSEQSPKPEENLQAQSNEALNEESADKAAEESLSIMNTANRANMDKKSLDLVFAVEQMIQARQHVERDRNELQDRLTHSNGHVERLNRDIKSLNKVIEERERNIMELEHKLIEKNLKVDQVMEDYREQQLLHANEKEELKNAIDLEQQKYANLLQKHNEAQADKQKKLNELEEKIGRAEAENSHLKAKYEAVRQEKTYLANMISDFTSRMSGPHEQGKSERSNGNADL